MNRKRFFLYVKEYFTFSRSERNGILILISGILLILGIRSALPLFYPPPPKTDIHNFEKEIAFFEHARDSIPHIFRKQDTNQNNTSKRVKSLKPRSFKPVEINSADSGTFIKLPGIGPVFAHRIIKYRKLLGGYYSLGQLTEVYGMKAETLTIITKMLTVDTLNLVRLKINTASFRDILKHPYITYDQTKKIVNLRKTHPIISGRQLAEHNIFTDLQLQKIIHYLTFE